MVPPPRNPAEGYTRFLWGRTQRTNRLRIEGIYHLMYPRA